MRLHVWPRRPYEIGIDRTEGGRYSDPASGWICTNTFAARFISLHSNQRHVSAEISVAIASTERGPGPSTFLRITSKPAGISGPPPLEIGPGPPGPFTQGREKRKNTDTN